MAWETNVGQDTTIAASADLSAKQFCVVTAAGAVAGAGVEGLGILQNAPTSGHAASVRYGGISKAIYGGSVAVGAELTADANGHLVTATTGNYVIAQALEAGASGETHSVALTHVGIL